MKGMKEHAYETFLTAEQIPQLLATLQPGRRATVALIIATGMRWAEAMRFSSRDLNRSSWEIHIRGTKTAGSARTIVVPEMFRGLLDHVPGALAPWPSVNLGLRRACARVERQLCAEAKGKDGPAPTFPRVTPNDLRRTFGSLLVQAGTPLEVVARLMGHSSTAMVYRVYGRFTPGTLAKLVPNGRCVQSTTVPPVYHDHCEIGRSMDAVDAPEIEISRENRFRRRDSNPNKRNQNPLSCH